MLIEAARAYIPMDRRQALARGQDLPERTVGAALFADISGFTPLTEALARELGPRRGAEELTLHLNRVYDALIAELQRYGGSVIGFSGDAITCWLDAGSEAGMQAPALRAVACGLAMQAAMHHFGEVRTFSGSIISLALKIAIACGPVRRFVVGDPHYTLLDTMAGRTLEQMAAAEHHAQRGEVVVHSSVLQALADGGRWTEASLATEIAGWREDEAGERFAIVSGLRLAAPEQPWPPMAAAALTPEQERVWLLPPVYQRLQRGKGEFLAELRPAVALFLRFEGIQYDEDENAPQKLHEFICGVQQILARYEASLIQLTIGEKGSYLYAAFGAPIAHEDDAERACAAALDLQEMTARLAYLAPLQIGITQGRMRTGAYGSAGRRTYGVLGDSVNLAARLMAAARPGQILASHVARSTSGEIFRWESLPEIYVKGKKEPISLWRLVRVRRQQTVHLHQPKYHLPMVGRAEEKAAIGGRLEQALQGRGQIVAITAEAGMGKSRLAAEIVQLAQERGFEVFAGECQSYGLNSSYLVWQPIWRRFFGLDPSWRASEQAAALESQLVQIDPSLAPRLPLLEAVLNVAIPDNDLTQSFDARLRKTSLESLLVDCLRARSRSAPLLLVLDDCQWLDQLSYDLLEVVGRAIAGLPVMLMLAYRPTAMQHLQLPRMEQLPTFVKVELADFTADEAQQLITLKLRQFLGETSAAPGEFVTKITARAAGNPFYIEEILNYLQDLAVDPHDTGRLAGIDLPSSIYSLILSRIDQLNERQQITIKVASVIGRLFPAAMVWGVYPELGEKDSVLSDLERLSEIELTSPDVPDPELTYLFKHVLTQEVAYESLPFATRATLHGQSGQYMESAYAHSLERYVDLLAFHYDRSENGAKRREYLLKAGEAAQANYANAAAVDYYRRLLPLLPEAEKGPALYRLGQVLDWVGEYGEAEASYREALRLVQVHADGLLRAQCQVAIGELARKQSDYSQAEDWFAQAQATAQQNDDLPGVAKALICLGSLAFYQGDYEEANAYYMRSLALRRQLHDRQNEANVLNNIGIVAASKGDFDRAEALFSEGLAVRRRLQQKWTIANSLGNLGQLAIDRQQYSAAQTYLEEALTLHRETGDRWRIGNSQLSLANIRRAQGDYAAAHDLYCESLRINRDLGDRWLLAFLLEDVGGLYAQLGRPEQALRLAGAGAALREVIGAPLSPTEQSKLDQVLDPARQALDAEARQSAWDAGKRLSLEEAIEAALQETNVPSGL